MIMNKIFQPPENQNDRHLFRAFYISSNGSWRLKESIHICEPLSEISIISNILNCDNHFNIPCQRRTKHSDLIMNKLSKNHETQSSSDLIGNPPRKKNGVSPLKGEKYPERKSPKKIKSLSLNKAKNKFKVNNSCSKVHPSQDMFGSSSEKQSPSKRQPLLSDTKITKFRFKDSFSEFDPSQDIFQSTISTEEGQDSELSSVSCRENGNGSRTRSSESPPNKRKRKKKKSTNITIVQMKQQSKFDESKINRYTLKSSDEQNSQLERRRKLVDITDENFSVLDSVCSGTDMDDIDFECYLPKEVISKIDYSSYETTNSYNESKQTDNSNCLQKLCDSTLSEELVEKTEVVDTRFTSVNPELEKDQSINLDSDLNKTQSDITCYKIVENLSLVKNSQEKLVEQNEKSCNINNKLKPILLDVTGDNNMSKVEQKTNADQKKSNCSFKEDQIKEDAIRTEEQMEKYKENPEEESNCDLNQSPFLKKLEDSESSLRTEVQETRNDGLSNNLPSDINSIEISSQRNVKMHKSKTKIRTETWVEEIVEDDKSCQSPPYVDTNSEANINPNYRDRHKKDQLSKPRNTEEYQPSESDNTFCNVDDTNSAQTISKAGEDNSPRKRKRYESGESSNNSDAKVEDHTESVEMVETYKDWRVTSSQKTKSPSKIKNHSMDKLDKHRNLEQEGENFAENTENPLSNIENSTPMKKSKSNSPKKRKKHKDKSGNDTCSDLENDSPSKKIAGNSWKCDSTSSLKTNVIEDDIRQKNKNSNMSHNSSSCEEQEYLPGNSEKKHSGVENVNNLHTSKKTGKTNDPRKREKHMKVSSSKNIGTDVDDHLVINQKLTHNSMENLENETSKSDEADHGNSYSANLSVDFGSNSETDMGSLPPPQQNKDKHKKRKLEASNFEDKNHNSYTMGISLEKKKKKPDKIKENRNFWQSNISIENTSESDIDDPDCDFDSINISSSSEDTPEKKKHLPSTSKSFSRPSEPSRKKNPKLFSSTPYQARKKDKGHRPKKDRNCEISLFDSTRSSSLHNSSLIDSILDDVQCHLISPEEELQKLETLDIEINWELSPLHKVDTGSSKMNLTKLKEKLGSRHSNLINENKFTKEDEEKIKKAWEEFSKLYNFSNPEVFTPTTQNYGHFKNEQRHKFKLFLAKYLPTRRLFSVYRKFINMYEAKKKGRWSEKEDRLLLDLYCAYKEGETMEGEPEGGDRTELKFGLPMKRFMTKALNRTWSSVDARLKLLMEDDHARSLAQKDLIWSPELEGALVYNLIKKSKVQSLEDLRYKPILHSVWRKVAAKLGLPLDRAVNQWKYHLYPQLFARQPVLRHQLKEELIKWFFKSKIKDLKSVDWGDLSRRAADLGSCYLFRVFTTLISNYVPKDFRHTFRESVSYLNDYLLPKLQEQDRDSSYLLTRKRYNPDLRTLTVIDEDEEEVVPFKIKDQKD